MILAQKIKIAAETNKKNSIQHSSDVLSVCKEIEKIMKILKDEHLTSCLIHPPEMNKFGQFINYIYINLNSIKFKWIEGDDDDFKGMDKAIEFNNLYSFLEQRTGPAEIKEISLILSSENTAFELN